MSVEAISNVGGLRLSRRSRLLAWIWPDPLETRERKSWLAGLLAWLWPTPLHDQRYGRRHGVMATLFGWAWPSEIDSAMKRFWRKSWLWAWMWPGRVSGPDGEICPLAPWHPAARPEVCEGEPWSRKVSRHGAMVFMMCAATAIAAPTFMAGDNGALDGGRLNLFHSGPADPSPPALNGGGGAGGQSGGAGGGAGGGMTGGGPTGPSDGDPGPTSNPVLPGDPSGEGFDSGLIGGETPPGPPGPTLGGSPGGPGTTFLDTELGDDLSPENGLLGVAGGGGGGGSGGSGGSGAGGSGGGEGGGVPGDSTGPEDNSDPFTPPVPNPGPDAGPDFDPPGPLGPPEPGFPQTPPLTGGNDKEPTGGEGCMRNCGLLPPGPGPDLDGGRQPAGAIPEPGTWAMMIMGFGLAGYAIRRRRVAVRFG